MEHKFTPWKKFVDRKSLTNIRCRGIYAIAICDENISETKFSFIQNIVYIGMTNSKGGLIQRLAQFDDTIRGKAGHGGASRFLLNYKVEILIDRLFVSILAFGKTGSESDPKLLRDKGDVAQAEYLAWAEYASRFKALPIYNDDMSRVSYVNKIKKT